MSETLYEKIGRVMSILQSISEHANSIQYYSHPPDSIVIADLVRQIRYLAGRATSELKECQEMADRLERLVRSKLQ
jgi:hypothetical protein